MPVKKGASNDIRVRDESNRTSRATNTQHLRVSHSHLIRSWLPRVVCYTDIVCRYAEENDVDIIVMGDQGIRIRRSFHIRKPQNGAHRTRCSTAYPSRISQSLLCSPLQVPNSLSEVMKRFFVAAMRLSVRRCSGTRNSKTSLKCPFVRVPSK